MGIEVPATPVEKKWRKYGVDPVQSGVLTPRERLPGGKTVYMGEIHIAPERLEGPERLAIQTIVHEASHKFASTEDFNGHGYFGETGRPDITADQCLRNADSYGWFVVTVGS